eukprot:6191674-Pleurochrysis_carterae.AAC.4
MSIFYSCCVRDSRMQLEVFMQSSNACVARTLACAVADGRVNKRTLPAAFTSSVTCLTTCNEARLAD